MVRGLSSASLLLDSSILLRLDVSIFLSQVAQEWGFGFALASQSRSGMPLCTSSHIGLGPMVTEEAN